MTATNTSLIFGSKKQIFKFFLLMFLFLYLLTHYIMQKSDRSVHEKPSSNKSFITSNAMNDARWSQDLNGVDLNSTDDDSLHIVTNIVLVKHNYYNRILRYNTEIPLFKQLQERQSEVEMTLQDNLNNEKVATVHVLFYHPAVALYLLKLPLKNSKKLVLHITNRDPTERENFEYIQNFLKYKIVVLMHMDILIGDGWDMVNKTHLKTNKLVYALTRHSITNDSTCDAAGLFATCHQGSKYIGSHDAFVFYSDQDFPSEMLNEFATFGANSNGIENVIIWYLREKMGYKVINPCRKLVIFHRHCIPIRNTDRKRFNRNGKNGLAPFTDEMV